MATFPHLKILTVFSSLSLLIETTRGGTPAGISHDGGNYIKQISRGKKGSHTPGFLLFTAPYKLCENGCNDTNNFVMEFPLYIGKRGIEMYKGLYDRDFIKYQSKRPNAPFRKKTTRQPITPCPIQTVKIVSIITQEPIEITVETTTEKPVSTSADEILSSNKAYIHFGPKFCPLPLPAGVCVKKKKKSRDLINYILKNNDFYDVLKSDYDKLE